MPKRIQPWSTQRWCRGFLASKPCFWVGAIVFAAAVFSLTAGERELIRDPHFQSGFFLLEPKPGNRVPYGEVPGLSGNAPVWDLAQWSSRFPVHRTNLSASADLLVCSNRAKTIVIGKPGTPRADLSLAVDTGAEYLRTRKSTSEPWVHLLVQQNFQEPPSLASLGSLQFHLEAQLIRSRLTSTNDYQPSIHAAQFLVYLTVGNRNPKAPGYQECFWFGIPVYDNRDRIVPAYEAQDFGDTKLFIFTPSSDTFANKSIHDAGWVTIEKDLRPLMLEGLAHAKSKGFIKGSIDPADFCPLGIFIGWEVPGSFDVDLQIRNLALTAKGR